MVHMSNGRDRRHTFGKNGQQEFSLAAVAKQILLERIQAYIDMGHAKKAVHRLSVLAQVDPDDREVQRMLKQAASTK